MTMIFIKKSFPPVLKSAFGDVFGHLKVSDHEPVDLKRKAGLLPRDEPQWCSKTYKSERLNISPVRIPFSVCVSVQH